MLRPHHDPLSGNARVARKSSARRSTNCRRATTSIPKAKIRNFKPPVGEAYARIEGPKGELGFHLISDGTANPYRYRVRPPSFINLTLLEDMCLGLDLADVVIILGSIDIVLGEVDR